MEQRLVNAVIERLDKIIKLLERIDQKADKLVELKYSDDVKSGKIRDTRCDNRNFNNVRCKSVLGHIGQHEY